MLKTRNAVLLVLLGTVLTTWAIGLIPFNKLPVSSFWQVLASRSISTISSLILIGLFCPIAFRRFKGRLTSRRFVIGLAIVAYLQLPGLIHSAVFSASLCHLLEGLVFSMFIGIDEELFSRGLIFGALEGFGVGIAAAISSIHFGLLHLGNFFWGGQSLTFTLGQTLSAASFGYLACGLMLFTGSIWVPVLMHGIADLPMQFFSNAQFTKEVTGGANWIGVIVESAIFILIGWTLIRLSRANKTLTFQS